MTSIRPFHPQDILRFNNVNLDPLTETYGFNFYLFYLVNWPEFYQVAEHPSGEIMGYIMGKAEGRDENWHGHVTALSVAPTYRRLGLARTLMNKLEETSESKKCYFVDLFVRVSNQAAISTYNNLGYVVYRQILDYYTGDYDEDAYGMCGDAIYKIPDMRKALSMDVDKKSVIPLAHPVRARDVE